MSELLPPGHPDRRVGEALLVEVEAPPRARGQHAALRLQRPRLVRPQLAVERRVDRPDVGGPDGGQGEEAVLPGAGPGDALVHVEQAGEAVGHGGLHAEQLAGKVAPLEHRPVGRRVEAVVVPRREVDDQLEEACGAVAAAAAAVQQVVPDVVATRVELVGREAPAAGLAEEVVERVVDALDLEDGRIGYC